MVMDIYTATAVTEFQRIRIEALEKKIKELEKKDANEELLEKQVTSYQLL